MAYILKEAEKSVSFKKRKLSFFLHVENKLIKKKRCTDQTKDSNTFGLYLAALLTTLCDFAQLLNLLVL